MPPSLYLGRIPGGDIVMPIHVGAATELGPRDVNEDSSIALHASYTDHDVALIAVCDGMGGDRNGARASAEVVSSLRGFLDLLPSKLWNADTVIAHDLVRSAILTWQRVAIDRLQAVQDDERIRGLSTTLVACLMWQDHLATWWLGDSRAYLFRDGRLIRLTADHSKVEQVLRLSEEEALEHPERNKITRFMRPGIDWQPDISFHNWKDGDAALVATDGITGSCRSWELEAFTAYWLSSNISPTALCDRIVRYVHPNLLDNATVAAAVAGTPKPYGGQVATLDLSTLLFQGLREDLVGLLKSPPVSAEDWRDRVVPPWRSQMLDESQSPGTSFRIAGRPSATPPDRDRSLVCLECGRIVEATGQCPVHDPGALWEGLYVEIATPHGAIQRLPLKGSLTLGRRIAVEGHSDLNADELISPLHVRLAATGGDRVLIEDQQSDNGVWMRVRTVELPVSDWPPDGAQFIVGQHRLRLRATNVGGRVVAAHPSGSSTETSSSTSGDQLPGDRAGRPGTPTHELEDFPVHPKVIRRLRLGKWLRIDIVEHPPET